MSDTAVHSPVLRFATGARSRDTGVFYDESKVLATTAGVMPEAAVPPGDWLQEVTMIVTATSAGNAAAVAVQPDAPFVVFSEVAFLDAAGNTVHALSGYNLWLVNLLGGYKYQSDLTKSPSYVTPVLGAGATGGSFSFTIRIPVQIIDREFIGAYPNAASNAVTRIRLTLNTLANIYSVLPTNAPTVNVKMIETGAVIPADTSPAGTPYAPEPAGAGTFQQWTQNRYDLNTVGRRTFPHNRKGQTYRGLILVTRNAAGARIDTILNEVRFSVDDVASLRGPWTYARHCTWERQNLVAAADLPAGVAMVDFAHEWDGKVGGELRDAWVITAPGSKVEFELDVAVVGTLEVITNEVIPVAGSGVLRV
jgi:hypothetical protein